MTVFFRTSHLAVLVLLACQLGGPLFGQTPAPTDNDTGVLVVRHENVAQQVIVAVKDSADESIRCHWFIDDQPVTAAPVKRALELVLQADKQRPGSTCHVVIYRATSTVTSERMSLDSNLWIQPFVPAPPRILSVRRFY